MAYLTEVRIHWRALVSASLGLMAGSLCIYINSLFAPPLLAAFGWEKSQLALIGLTTTIAAIFLPITGRVADRIGARPVAIVGVIALPLDLLALSRMNGDFRLFFFLSLIQMLIVSCLTGALIYGRLIAQRFDMARGMALGVAACMPPLLAMLLSPVLSWIIEAHGWRNGYVFLAALTAMLGGIALLLMPPDLQGRRVRAIPRQSTKGYIATIKQPAFLLTFLAMLLCNLHFTIQTTHLKVVLLQHGVDPAFGSWMISLFSMGVLIGRVLCGIALDRFQPHLVAVICLGIPGLGLAILAANVTSPPLLILAIMTLGVSLGSESDLVVYLASRYFERDVFSTVLGGFTGAMAVSALIGSLLLSFMLKSTGSYSPLLAVSAVSVVCGACLLLLLPRAVAWSTRGNGVPTRMKTDLIS